ncbi:MAG: GDP-mannose 4,6-dehydratase [Chloroflexota bacterium]|nr:GDP-mannose 4,6-dehydratase [Chloroflexota bacterium]
MEILVTGGAGFVGSHTVEALLARGERVIALDNFNDYYSPDRKRRNIMPFLDNPNFRMVTGDIRDLALLEHLFTTEPIRRVIHLAAMAGVRSSIKDPLLYEEVNVRGTMNLLELAVKQGVVNFVHASSSSVYGDAPVPYREDARTDRPLSPYAATKKMAEVMLYTYNYLYGLPTTLLRFFTVYGPRGRPDMAVYLFTDWIEKGQPVRLYGDGTQGRDYTYVADTVSGILAALDRPSGYRIFNLGNSQPHSNARLIELIEQELGKKAKIEMLDYPNLDPPQTCADISRAREDLGYHPRVSLEEGVHRFVEWYRAQ